MNGIAYALILILLMNIYHYHTTLSHNGMTYTTIPLHHYTTIPLYHPTITQEVMQDDEGGRQMKRPDLHWASFSQTSCLTLKSPTTTNYITDDDNSITRRCRRRPDPTPTSTWAICSRRGCRTCAGSPI
jgi:hypothetical protein